MGHDMSRINSPHFHSVIDPSGTTGFKDITNNKAFLTLGTINSYLV